MHRDRGATVPPLRSAAPGTVPKEGETYAQRLTSRSAADYVIDEQGCWIWQKYIGPRGYPQAGQGKAHHIYWSLANGRPVPKHWHVHHRCEVRACVNPDHLELLTLEEHFRRHAYERTGLTAERIEEIRVAASDPRLRYIDLEAMFEVDRQTIMRIIRGFRHGGEVVQVNRPPCLYCGAELVGGYRNRRFCNTEHHAAWKARELREAPR